MRGGLASTMKHSSSRAVVTTVALGVLSVALLRLASPRLAHAVKVRARPPEWAVASVCADITPGDDDVLQRLRSDAFGFATARVAAMPGAAPAATRRKQPILHRREPMRVRQPLHRACRRAASGDDLPG